MNRLLLLAALAASHLLADVTARYTLDIRFASYLPQQMAEGVKGKMQAEMNGESVSLIRVKGARAHWKEGRRGVIADFNSRQMIVVDGAGHRFAATTVERYAALLRAAVPAKFGPMAKALESVKTEFRATGRTETIQGVNAEEREIAVSFGNAVPAAPDSKLVLRIWTPAPGEALRVPAIRELTGVDLWRHFFTNPVQALGKVFGSLPGWDGFGPAFANANPVLLRMSGAVHVPALARMAEAAAAQGRPLAGFDPNAPVIEFIQELVELSTAPVPDSAFTVPAGYAKAPVEALLAR